MIGLPTLLEVNGKSYAIRTDFRAVLDIISAFNDKLCDDSTTDAQCKAQICMQILYEDYESIPADDLQEAYKQAIWFIDCGNKYTEDKKEQIRLMDWEQDEQIIFPAINRVAGKEVRSLDYLHWWTFMGMYMEIGECLFSSVIQIRQKKSKGKKLEKNEQEFYRENKNMVVLKRNFTPEEEHDKSVLDDILKELT